MKTRIALLIVALSALLFPASALADGIIIPDPPICDPAPCPEPIPMAQLAIKYHHVSVTIQDQVAITHVDQVFYNPNDWQVEGTYLFPIPQEAVVTNFVLWIDGQAVEGQVLDAQQARQTYEDIVRRMADPALLEYAGRGAVQARIFPIPPQGERRIELEYTQALAAENGLVRYVYPLNTEKFSLAPLESVSVSVDVRSSSVPIRAAYSPTHDIAVSRDGDFHITAGYEAANITPNTDFALVYSLGESEAFHLLSYRDPTDPVDADGYFLLLLAPRPDAATQPIPKDVILVLDRSGSMEGEKFLQAQEALREIIGQLSPQDRFNLIVFSTGLETYASVLRPVDEADEAIAWVDNLSPRGSTDINRALLEAAAMVDGERPTYLIFLTDGLPTEGEIDSQKIIANFEAAAPDNLRLFAFGVGYDVDTLLLDTLAQGHHGTTSYVLPGEQLDEIVSAFYEKISTPVMTDLTLDFGGLAAYDLYPDPLPDLFVGSQIIVVGRYREGGSAAVELNGVTNAQAQTFTFPEQIFEQQSTASSLQSAIPRLWATRKIGYLLNHIRLNGADQETIDQIVKLSIRFGIVTPYTSYLVTEEMALGAAAQEELANLEFERLTGMPTAPASGQAAVEKSADQSQLQGAGAPASPSGEAANRVKIVGARTFVLNNGIWTDTAFDPTVMQAVKVPFLSEDYFTLSAARADLAAAFALGQRVIAISDGIAYEVVSADEQANPITIPPTATPAPIQIIDTPASTLLPESPKSTPTQPASGKAPAGLPCLGALLPLLIIPLVVLRPQRQKR